MRTVLVDTGPIVALLNRRDSHHERSRQLFAALPPPLHTCEPVLAEACHLLRRSPGGAAAALRLVERGVLQVGFRIESEAGHLRALMERYASIPMSLADAALVRMCELDGRSEIATFDADFHVYRRNGRQPLRLLTLD